MHQVLSERIEKMAESATLAMSQQTQALQAQGYDVCDLGIGEPYFPTPAYIQQAAKEAIDSGAYFGYPPIAGYMDLREAIAQKLYAENKIICKPSQVIVSTGAKQSLANLFLCLLNPGDEVIVYTPYWVTYASLIELAGGKPIFLKGKQEDNFEPTAEQLEQAITLKTKAIIFSSPCNPTGLVLSRSSLLAMADVLGRHQQVLVIADEIYEYIHFMGSHTSIGSLAAIQDRVITVNGFSKGFAMTGWRVGYLAAPVWLAKACEKIQGQLTSATCSIAQRAALAALTGNKAALQDRMVTYCQLRELAMQLLGALPGFKFNKPWGAFYLFPDISHYFGYTDGTITIRNAHDFCLYILREARVALVAGDSFGEPRCIRLSYAVPAKTLQKGIQRMAQVIQHLKPS